MSGRTKLFLITLAALALGGFLVFAGIIDPERLGQTASRPAQPVNPPSPADTARSITPEPSAAPDEDAVAALYWYCVLNAFPTRANAAARATACSKALQTRQLRPHQIALARLTRGIARTLLGNMDLASEDYLYAVQRYDDLIDSGNPDALVLFRRAVALNASGQTDKVLMLEPDNVDALIARGDAFSNLGDSGRAMVDLNRAVTRAPDCATSASS